MIKAILFDFDGVLTIEKTGSTSITKYISKATKIPLDIVKTCYYKYNKALLKGDIVHKDMWNSFCNDLGKDIDYQILIESFKNTALDMKMIGLIKQLRRNYMIALITDNKCDRIDTILHNNNLQRYFNIVAVSANLHSGKDSIEIFQYVTNNLGVAATECIFIDNSERNLIIPDRIGMKTILFNDDNRDFDGFIKALNEFLL